jgi:uncharacterized membrane protein
VSGEERPPLVHWALAHHRPADVDRCLLLRWGGRRVALCARCAGLYPVLGVALALQLAIGTGPLGGWDWAVALGGVVPMVVDWGAGRLRAYRGSNLLRALTGAVGGIALGRSIYLHLKDPSYEVLWVQLALLAFALLAVELVRGLGLDDG